MSESVGASADNGINKRLVYRKAGLEPTSSSLTSSMLWLGSRLCAPAAAAAVAEENVTPGLRSGRGGACPAAATAVVDAAAGWDCADCCCCCVPPPPPAVTDCASPGPGGRTSGCCCGCCCC